MRQGGRNYAKLKEQRPEALARDEGQYTVLRINKAEIIAGWIILHEIICESPGLIGLLSEAINLIDILFTVLKKNPPFGGFLF